MRAARLRRVRERGNAEILIAVSAVTLLAITGLAVDGGMAVGAYRHAQNAADAGALAAARRVYLNAMSSPRAPSNPSTLTPVAQAEVQRNRATLGTVTTGGATSLHSFDTPDGISISYQLADASLGAVATGSETVYVPNAGQGLTADTAMADITGTAGPPLSPVDAELELVGAHATATMNLPPPNGSGSNATANVDVAHEWVHSANQSASVTCYNGAAQYTSGQDTPATVSPCADSATPLFTTVSAVGAQVTSPDPDAHVGSDNHPSASPEMIVNNPSGSDNGTSASATVAASGARLGWTQGGTLQAESSLIATGASASTTGLTVQTALMQMTVSATVDSKGNAAVHLSCAPTTVTLSGSLVGAVAVTSNVDSSCHVSGLPVSDVTVGWTQPQPGSACSTAAATGVVTCQIQACFAHIAVPGLPFNTTICLGESNLSLSATPVSIPSCCSSTPAPSPSPSGTPSGGATPTPSGGATPTPSGAATPTPTPTSSSTPTPSATATPTPTPSPSQPPNLWVTQFTGAVTVTAQVDQPTYFLSILGWRHTTPAATATADIESVVDESPAAFASDPFAMPDAAWSLDAPSHYEHLTLGHSYYLYGAQMQANSPAPVMPSTWQGQLAATSAHRVGQALTGSSTLTTTPQPFMSDGSYCLVPIFNPNDGTVEMYGVFAAAPSHPGWYTLVNSVPVSGHLVQSASVPGWITFEEGAVSIKLVQ